MTRFPVVAAPLLVGTALGCAGAAPKPDGVPDVPDLVLALPAGAERVIRIHPRPWLAQEHARELLTVLVPEREQAAFERRVGAPLAQIEEVVIAEYPGDRVTLVRGLAASTMVANRDGTPRGPAVLDSHTLVLRRTGPAGAIARAMRSGPGDPALADLVTAEVDQAFQVLVPHPIAFPARSGVGALLARHTGVSASLSPASSTHVAVALEIHGAFPASAERNFLALYDSLAVDPLGAELGLSEARPSFRLVALPSLVQMRLELPVARLHRVLSAMIDRDAGSPFSPDGEVTRSGERS